MDLVCCTEREKFVVPVHALGLRAVLNLPDAVDFGVCPVKSTATKTLIAQNVGTCTANFTLAATPSCFTASPPEGIVEVGQTIMIELSFTPEHAEPCSGELCIKYVGRKSSPPNQCHHDYHRLTSLGIKDGGHES